MIYRRGVSVIISPSLSSSRRRAPRLPVETPVAPSVYPHPSGYRDCGPISASAAVGPARSGAPLNGRVSSSLSAPPARLIHSFLPYCFRELPASRACARARGTPRARSVTVTVRFSGDVRRSFSRRKVSLEVPFPLSAAEFSEIRPQTRSSTLMRYRAA